MYECEKIVEAIETIEQITSKAIEKISSKKLNKTREKNQSGNRKIFDNLTQKSTRRIKTNDQFSWEKYQQELDDGYRTTGSDIVTND